MNNNSTEQAVKEKLPAKSKLWVRGLQILLFLIVWELLKAITWLIAIFQWLSLLFIGKPNARLLDFSQNLALYLHQILKFAYQISDQVPFPFSNWPNQKLNNDLTQ